MDSAGVINRHLQTDHRNQLTVLVQGKLDERDATASQTQEGADAAAFVCGVCNESFNSQTDVQMHLKTVHQITAQLSLHFKYVFFGL